MQDRTVASGLIRRRRELAGEIEALLERVQAIADNVRALDQTILLFDPDAQPEAIPALRYSPREDWAARGEIQRAIFEALRLGPLDGAEITRRVMEARGVDPNAYPVQRKRVGRALDKMRARGLVRSIEETGLWLQWEIVR